MRADRLLTLLHHLQRHGRLPARRLAELLEVSERTVLRDMEALSAAGVPVYLERGRHGGCRLLDGWRTDVSGLTPDEAQALFLWGGRDAAGDLGLGPELGRAVAKLAATVPAPALDRADALASVLVVDRRRWFAAAEEVPALPVLREAATDRRRVRITYESSGRDRPTTRTLDPYGLVENAGRWYLLAAHRGETRTYRVSRIGAVRVLEQAATIPDEFDLAAEWERVRSRFESGDAVSVEVVVDTGSEELFRRLVAFQTAPGTTVESEPDGDRVRLRLTLRVRRQAIGLLLTFGGAAELVAPADLRAELVSTARAALDRHVG